MMFDGELKYNAFSCEYYDLECTMKVPHKNIYNFANIAFLTI